MTSLMRLELEFGGTVSDFGGLSPPAPIAFKGQYALRSRVNQSCDNEIVFHDSQ